MKKIIYPILFLVITAVVILFLLRYLSVRNNGRDLVTPSDSDSLKETLLVPENIPQNNNIDNQEKKNESSFQFPLDKATGRVSKKPFGIFITPTNSPVQPEKFSGYHAGVDFEIFTEEVEMDIEIKAVCSGKLLAKRNASGYGGVAVQSCDLDEELITIIYGHLKLDSIKAALGDDIALGEPLGMLGRAYSSETSGERKHLHLAVHKGAEVNILGYVSTQSALSGWLDPMLFLK